MAIDLRDIRLFVAVYEERSFTAAAKREFTTQPSISQRIRKIEDRFGVELFLRGKQSVEPTPAGGIYYRKCVEILRLHAEVAEELARYKGETTGELRVGLLQSLTRSVMAPTMNEFMRGSPNVTVRVFESFGNVLLRRVRSGQLEFAVVPAFLPGIRDAGIVSRPFLRSPEFFVARNDHSRQTLTPVQLSELGPLSLILPPAENLRRAKLDEYIHRNNVSVEHVLEIDASSAWIDFASRTQWCAILPGLLILGEARNPDITLHPIVAPPLFMELVLIHPARSVLSESAQRFIEILRKETSVMNRQLYGYAGLELEHDAPD